MSNNPQAPEQGGTLDTFPRSWTARILPGPPMIAPARHFVFPQDVPGEEEAMLRGACFVQVTPASGSGFLAACARGFNDRSLPSGLWASPSPEHLLAVAGGYAYLIVTDQPEKTVLLNQRPVTAVLPAEAEKLLLLFGFHDILAVGPNGPAWRTGRLSWEGLAPGAITKGQLHGQGWDMFTDREVPFSVDLRSGKHQGGGYNPARA